MDHLPIYLKRFWRYVKNGIAFIPGLYVLGFILLALVLGWLEQAGLSTWFDEDVQIFVIRSKDTARTILSVVIGGIISLTVFSFSMVMLVLSQATNTLSPRLLPQLIRDRSHQTVLGLYLGVIVFSFLTLINMELFQDDQINGFSVFLCVIMGIGCLAMFVYFIASISKRIQVGEVILKVRAEAMNNLDKWIEGPQGWDVADQLPATIDTWDAISLPESGYLDLPTYDELSGIAAEYDTLIYLDTYRSAFVLAGTPVLRLSREFTPEQQDEIAAKVTLSKDDIGMVWYLQSVRHITEVAVKAMSPGINDPGTALECIDILIDILRKMLEVPPYNHYANEEVGGRIYFRPIEIKQVLQLIMQEIRCYAKADPIVMQRLTVGLFQLRHIAKLDANFCAAIDEEVDSLEEDCRSSITNSRDRKLLLALLADKRSTYNKKAPE